MKIDFPLGGSLTIVINSEKDWDVLAMMAQDISSQANLAESLGGLMVEDSGWKEYVVPDLKEGFNQQSNYVATVINNARSQEQGTIHIEKENAELWYGAVNQARLALEARYNLSEIEDIGGATDKLYEVYCRDGFYHIILCALLEYIMSEA